jgi:signal-transduction protein with cAMP-binding, CBS, and nucleotidyltransferase domain
MPERDKRMIMKKLQQQNKKNKTIRRNIMSSVATTTTTTTTTTVTSVCRTTTRTVVSSSVSVAASSSSTAGTGSTFLASKFSPSVLRDIHVKVLNLQKNNIHFEKLLDLKFEKASTFIRNPTVREIGVQALEVGFCFSIFFYLL